MPLAEFALAKKLPVDFLAANSAEQSNFVGDPLTVRFRYWTQAGKMVTIRHRTGTAASANFAGERATGIILGA